MLAVNDTQSQGGREPRHRRTFGGSPRRDRFLRDEAGSFTILTLFLILVLLMVAGVAVDAVRFEAQRARIQNTLDRAVLAAADMQQQLSAATVVHSYLEKAGLGEYYAEPEVSQGFNAKVVSATASSTMKTFFMRLVGIDTLAPSARSAAEESISDIEVSLVLDISGSMRTEVSGSGRNRPTKLEALQSAATEFVDTIFSSTVEARTSMSIVPYSSQVNAGPTLLSRYPNVTTFHTFNNCLDFESADFETTALDPNTVLERTDPLDVWNVNTAITQPDDLMCDVSVASRVLPISGNPTQLKAAINAMQAKGNTSIDIGMKWGSVLLDPSTQPVVDSLIATGDVAGEFEGRPFAYTDLDTMKVMVVMTDGEHTDQYILKDDYKYQKSGVWRYLKSGKAYYAIAEPEGKNTDRDADRVKNEPYWRASESGKEKWGATPAPSGIAAVELTWQEVFQDMKAKVHADLRKAIFNKQQDYTKWYPGPNGPFTQGPYTAILPATKDARMLAQCDAAKEQGIIVFTIGFEVTNASANLLKSCASSPSHFYRVDGLDIVTAFQSIANAIGKLRLTQ